MSIPLGALERALVLSPSERSDIGRRYPDPSEQIEFRGNPPGKSHELGCMSTSVASAVWLCCGIIDRVKVSYSIKFILDNYGDTTHLGLRPPKAKSLEKYSKNNKLEVECSIISYLDTYSS